jgi:branched-chain amino acid aminotransferase
VAADLSTFEWQGGELVEVPTAKAVPAEAGKLPLGAYTTLHVYPGHRVLRLGRHARRLSESTSIPLPVESLRASLAAALARSGHREAKARLTWAPPHLFVGVAPFEPLEASLYRDGVRCVSVGLHRDDPAAKDTRFIAQATAAYEGLPAGVHEGLLVGPEGQILEGLTSNVFAILNGTLRTEGSAALPGITRGLVLDASAGLLPIAERAVCLNDVPSLSEMFLTSASRGVLPVVDVDGSRVGAGVPGTLTREIASRFEALVEQEAKPLAD